ncbi:OmpA family protein [Vibrio parahaemolyticus]|jgi:outer membrane protein OmpA-like peptidoglycan-associated protein|uniref:OmpA family protein n=1 Tax=Vibrio mediterranei TaxID=689 RepID=UPI0022835628|nr:OmpA family protein [Vibrio mediterranei]MCY9854736.1 OmpA family protein [Vibrio mediterranei]
MRSLSHSPRTADAEESGVWLSVGDLMSVLLMIFALLLISALVQISEVYEESQNTRIVIIKDINDKLNAEGIGVQADPETGDISITDSILFDLNDYKLKASGQEFLEKFIPIYSDAIFQSQATADEVSRVVIEGHSSSEGAFDRNMELSVLRANSVIAFVNSMKFSNKQRFFDKAVISGRGPIEARQDAADAADRKVKFRFQFKDEEFLGNFSEVKKVE